MKSFAYLSIVTPFLVGSVFASDDLTERLDEERPTLTQVAKDVERAGQGFVQWAETDPNVQATRQDAWDARDAIVETAKTVEKD